MGMSPGESVSRPDVSSTPRSVVTLVVASLLCLAVGIGLSVYAAVEISEPLTVQPPSGPVQLPEDEVVRLFHEVSYYASEWADMTWMGVRTLQNPADMWVIQEIVCELRPDYIIETGTFHGGSSLYLAMLLEALGGDGKVLSIDIEPRVKLASRSAAFRERVEVFTASSTDPKLVTDLANRVRGKRVLVLLDSDHRRDHVLAELRAWGPLVSQGSYVIVQDTNLNGHPVMPDHGPGPWEAVETFLSENRDFEIDKGREKFLITYYPSGYLRRTRGTNLVASGGRHGTTR